MSGTVMREGRCQPVCRRHRPRRAAGHRGQCLVALRHLDEGHRHRGAAAIGRPHVGLHGAGRQSGRAAAMPAMRSAIRSTRRGCSCAARSRASAPTASRRRCGPSISEIAARPARRGRRQRRRSRQSSRATARPASSTISTSTTPTRIEATIDDLPRTRRPRRASPRPSTTTRCRKSAAPRRPASTTSAAPAPSASCRISTTCCSSAPRSRAIRSKAIARRCGTNVVLGTRFAKKPIELKIPITIAGMSFGSLSAQAKEALGRGATIAGTSTTTGDGGMTPEERGHSKTLVYQYLPSRYGMNPRRPAHGRRHRGRGRPGRQARRRRHAARPEDLRPRRRDAHPARRASTSARPAGIPTGPARTISRSRSTSCARSPTGRSRSTSRSAARGPITTPRSR